MNKCYFCNNPAIGVYRVCVEAEPDKEGGMVGIYDDVGLCKTHKWEWDEQEGIFDQYKYGGE